MPRPITHSCGVSTHISIAHEASFYMKNSNYADIVRKNQDAFVAGNPYPDFAYAKECLNYKYHAVSETTHWAPFLNATINYVRRNYKQPWNAVRKLFIAQHPSLFPFLACKNVLNLVWTCGVNICMT